MAVRHDVENLIRRGNIFYWRARVPQSFIRCAPGSRLSLSLQVSDHKKAQMIARQLNMRLAEMKLKPKEIMADREQLQKFFEHTRDAMCWFPRGTEPVFPPRSEPPLSMVF